MQIFSCYPPRGKGIVDRVLKFARYIHHHKILPGNIFGLIFFKKQKDGHHRCFLTFRKEFCRPSRAKVIIGRDIKFFTGYVHHYKLLTGNIFGLILKNKMATTGVSVSVMKQCVEIFLLPPLEQNLL